MNKIFVVSGPSGSGKSTLIELLMKKYDRLNFSISHTTRKKRDGESDSVDYYYITHDKFRKMIENKEFAEWAEVHGELYGTSVREINRKSTGEEILILDIDVQGAEIIKKIFPESILVFIKPPDMDELKNRLKKRERELTSDFIKRIKTAEKEIEKSVFYDHIVINDDLEKCFSELEVLFLRFKEKVSREDTGKKTGAGA